MQAPLPDDETARLAALHSYAILDTPAEESFDRIVRLTARFLDQPVAMINLIDRDRLWCKASSDGRRFELPRRLSFCAWTILDDNLTVAEDMSRDPRFADNPLVHGDPPHRFYAGAPLTTPEGLHLGALCVLAGTPGRFSEDQRSLLRTMAALVVGELELRLSSRRLTRELEERDRAERARRETEARLVTSIESLPFYFWMTDRDGRYILQNRIASRHWGDITGKMAGEVDQPPSIRALWAAVHARALAGETVRHEVSYEIDGAVSVMEEITAPVEHDGELIGLVGVGIDQTERRRLEAEVRELAVTDTLTGLPNRRVLMERLEAVTRSGRRAALVVIDIDRFKEVNDELGHDAGDHLLREFSGRLLARMRRGDVVARLEGDEFAIVLGPVGNFGDVRATIQELLAEIGRPVAWQDRILRREASAGIALFPDHGREPLALLKNADLALYRVKGRGGNGARLFTPAMRSVLEFRQRTAEALRRDLVADSFELHYQPVVALRQRRHDGFEALVRWNRDGTLEAPGSFLPIAEDTGLIVPLGRLVLRHALRQLRAWLDAGLAPGSVAVNVAAAQLRALGFVDEVNALLRELRLEPERLQLEITENVLLERDAARTRASLKALRGAGVGVALDDFGTGYASLTHLRRFPVSQIKIDRSFVANLAEDAADSAIVESLVNLARALRISVVAEGVETEAQCRQLTRWGCDYGQGRLFAAPLTGDGARSYLADIERSAPAPA